MPVEPSSLIAPAAKQVPGLLKLIMKTPSKQFPLELNFDNRIISNGGSKKAIVGVQFLNRSEEHTFRSCRLELGKSEILPAKTIESILAGNTSISFKTDEIPLHDGLEGLFVLRFITQIGEKIEFKQRVRITAYGNEPLEKSKWRYEISKFGAPWQRKFFW